MCHYLGGGLHGRKKRVKAQSESSKSVVNSVLISREMPVFPGFLEIIRVVYSNTRLASVRLMQKYWCKQKVILEFCISTTMPRIKTEGMQWKGRKRIH